MSDPKPRREPRLATQRMSRRKPRRALVTSFPVMLDTCVLASSTIRDFLLWAAYLALYRPVWSADILEELRRTLIDKFGVQPERADYMIGQMTTAFQEAEVDGYQALIPVMTNAEKDRHVLAASVIAKAQLIVTNNLRDFNDAALSPYHIEATNADNFLRDLLDVDSERMLEVLMTLAEQRKMPPRTVEELLQALEQDGCVGFAADMRVVLTETYADS